MRTRNCLLNMKLPGRIRHRIALCVLAPVLCMCLTGCTKKRTVTVEDVPVAEALAQAALESDKAQDAEAKALPEASGTDDEAPAAFEETARVIVHVCGAVDKEGVYSLPASGRIWDAVSMAGGMTQDADAAVVNLAQPLEDGMKIRIPTVQETVQWPPSQVVSTGNDTAYVSTGREQGSTAAVTAEGIVNLNTAGVQELMTLNGIGESYANAILRYREEHGLFQTIEEIKNVSGIGDKTFLKIRDRITV